MDDNGNTTLEATKSGLKITGRKTAELIMVLSLCVMAVGAYAFFKHEESTREDAKEFRDVLSKGNADIATALKELAAANSAQVKEQRVMNCLLSARQEDRRQMLSECERIAR